MRHHLCLSIGSEGIVLCGCVPVGDGERLSKREEERDNRDKKGEEEEGGIEGTEVVRRVCGWRPGFNTVVHSTSDEATAGLIEVEQIQRRMSK